jgi:hypothetical protein
LNAAEIEGMRIEPQCLKTETGVRNACGHAAYLRFSRILALCRKVQKTGEFVAFRVCEGTSENPYVSTRKNFRLFVFASLMELELRYV